MELRLRGLVRHDAVRWLTALLIMVLPAYSFLLLYRLSTGDWHQPVAAVLDGIDRSWQTLAAYFVAPLYLMMWILGYKGWRLVGFGLMAAVIASYILPGGSLAVHLLPGSFIRVGIVAVMLTILLHLATAVYERKNGLSDEMYTRQAMIVMGGALFLGAILLLPYELYVFMAGLL